MSETNGSTLLGFFGAFLRGASAGLLEERLVVNVGERGARLGVRRAQFFAARRFLLLVFFQPFFEGALALRQRLGELRQFRTAEQQYDDADDDYPLHRVKPANQYYVVHQDDSSAPTHGGQHS